MKNIILINMLLLLALVSCDRYVDSKDPVRSYPESGPVPSNISIQLDDSSVRLSWDINDPTAMVILYRIYIAEEENGDFRLYDSSAVTEATLSDLKVNTVYYFQVVPVYSGGVEGESSETVSAPVSFISMIISDNKEHTNSRNLYLRFTAPLTATHMIISEDSTFSDASYETYAVQKLYNITSEGDGSKIVYARLQFYDGSSTGNILSDDIILDTKVRIDSVFFLFSDSIFVPGDTIIFALDAGEEEGTASVSFSGVSRLELHDDGTEYDNIADDGIYHGWHVVPNGSNIFNGVVTGYFTDRATNRASAVEAFTRLNINTAPEPVNLSAYLSSDADSVYFNWTTSSASDFVNYRLFKDTLNSTVDTSDIVIYEVFNQHSTSFTYPSDIGTITYFKIYIYDRHGSMAGSNVISINNQ